MKVPKSVMKGVSGLPKTILLYYGDSYLKEFEAEVLKVVGFEDLTYVVLDRTCFFPEGGGQLGDIGSLKGTLGELEVVDTQAVDEVVVHTTVTDGDRLKGGDSVCGSIDWGVRYERMKQHTGSHVVFSATKRILGLDRLTYMGVEIREDSSRIDVSYGKPISRDQLREIEKLSNIVCLENRKVNAWSTTREEAEETYGERLGLTEVTPSGRVRIVEVEDWDVALCSGTHVRSTAEIGPISIIDRFRLKRGVERIEFTAGKHGHQRYDEAMETTTALAQMLKTSRDEVQERVGNLLKEREALKRELRKAKEQLVEAQTEKLLIQAEAVGDFRLTEEKLSNLDIQSLKRISTSLVEKDPHLIVFLGSNLGSKAFLVGAAGETALKQGVDIAEIIREAAHIIQGRGGGNSRQAQAGGKNPSRLEEALILCKEAASTKLQKL